MLSPDDWIYMFLTLMSLPALCGWLNLLECFSSFQGFCCYQKKCCIMGDLTPLYSPYTYLWIGNFFQSSVRANCVHVLSIWSDRHTGIAAGFQYEFPDTFAAVSVPFIQSTIHAAWHDFTVIVAPDDGFYRPIVTFEIGDGLERGCGNDLDHIAGGSGKQMSTIAEGTLQSR